MKSLFEQMDGTYTQQGDYYLPDLKLPPKEDRPIGVWGQRRLRYLRELPNSLYQPENHRSTPLPPCRRRGTSQRSFPSVSQRLCRLRRLHRATQGGGAYGVGEADERNTENGYGNRKL